MFVDNLVLLLSVSNNNTMYYINYQDLLQHKAVTTVVSLDIEEEELKVVQHMLHLDTKRMGMKHITPLLDLLFYIM